MRAHPCTLGGPRRRCAPSPLTPAAVAARRTNIWCLLLCFRADAFPFDRIAAVLGGPDRRGPAPAGFRAHVVAGSAVCAAFVAAALLQVNLTPFTAVSMFSSPVDGYGHAAGARGVYHGVPVSQLSRLRGIRRAAVYCYASKACNPRTYEALGGMNEQIVGQNSSTGLLVSTAACDALPERAAFRLRPVSHRRHDLVLRCFDCGEHLVLCTIALLSTEELF